MPDPFHDLAVGDDPPAQRAIAVCKDAFTLAKPLVESSTEPMQAHSRSFRSTSSPATPRTAVDQTTSVARQAPHEKKCENCPADDRGVLRKWAHCTASWARIARPFSPAVAP